MFLLDKSGSSLHHCGTGVKVYFGTANGVTISCNGESEKTTTPSGVRGEHVIQHSTALQCRTKHSTAQHIDTNKKKKNISS
jgi:hypothetical protein